MANAIAPGSEPGDARLREALRFASVPRSDNPEPANRPDTAGWDIATTADRLGISTRTLRCYERIRLMRVGRDALGHRHYDTVAVRRLVFLTRIRTSGMSIRDLRRYIELVEAGWGTVPERLTLLIKYREGLRTRIDEFQLALAATEYRIVGHTRELEGQAVPDNISTSSTNISNTDKEIPS